MRVIRVKDNIAISTYLLATSLLGFAESDDCIGEPAQELSRCSAGRLLSLSSALRFLFAGLVVTNALWVAHFMGWF